MNRQVITDLIAGYMDYLPPDYSPKDLQFLVAKPNDKSQTGKSIKIPAPVLAITARKKLLDPV